MKDVSVKAKAKLSYVLDGDLLDGLIKEDDLSAKASYLRKNYDFLGADDEKIILEDKLSTHFYKELRSL